MPFRGILILAFLAALVGAPSPKSTAGDDVAAAGAPAPSSPSTGDGAGGLAAGAEREDDGSDGSPVRDSLLQSVLLMGLAGVAAVALIGTAMLLAGRRREPEEEEPLPAVAAPESASRSRRRAVLTRMGEDPIIAAMGLGSDDAPRHRTRAGQVSSGPGERETGTRRR